MRWSAEGDLVTRTRRHLVLLVVLAFLVTFGVAIIQAPASSDQPTLPEGRTSTVVDLGNCTGEEPGFEFDEIVADQRPCTVQFSTETTRSVVVAP